MARQPGKTPKAPKQGKANKVTRPSVAAIPDDTVWSVQTATVSVNPAAAGPAGALLEGHVGAQYLLPLLTGSEARGLPGVIVMRVAFQRAGLGHPMDDVIVSGVDQRGRPATLELQAKRTVAFTASDPIFADVVAMATQVAAKPEFATTRYEIAVAIARTSTKIEQHIQNVLKWAREYRDAQSFFRRLNQSGAAHQAMRDFVAAFRTHAKAAGAAHGDADIWLLLSRFHVLAFDFEQPGSQCALLARDRCAMLLAQQDLGRAGEMLDSLCQIALELDTAGGDIDAASLRERLASVRGYRLRGERRLYAARERLAQMKDSVLGGITSNVRAVTIDRSQYVAGALSALEQCRYLEIRGAGGVGKSGVLKDLAQRIAADTGVAVIAPNRIPGGGWSCLQAQLGCDASARELLTDLAGDGGAVLLIDNLDRFDDARERATVVDLMNAAAEVDGFCVVVTVRQDFDADAREWLPQQALQRLGYAAPLLVEELNTEEVAELRESDPALASLLRPGHPAEKLVRNLYRLKRLAQEPAAAEGTVYSEAQMAQQWWQTGDAADSKGRLQRRQVLRSLAVHELSSSAPLDINGMPADAVEALVISGSLRLVSAVMVEPTHDVLKDWAVGCLLYHEPDHLALLPLTAPAPARLVRGVELAARMHAEFSADATGWQAMLELVSVPGAHGSWRRAVLLALSRSERAQDVLNRCLPVLATNGAAVLCDLLRAAIAIECQPAAPLWAKLGVDTSLLSDDMVIPRGPSWFRLIVWSLAIGERLPGTAAAQFGELYSRWCTAFTAKDELSPLLVARLHTWLIQVEDRNHPDRFDLNVDNAADRSFQLSMTGAQEDDLRTAFLFWCKVCPNETDAYLRRIASHPGRRTIFRHLLTFSGTAAEAAPAALADLFLKLLTEGDERQSYRHTRLQDTFVEWDREYYPASPARAPFLNLLQADKEQGLRLIRGVISYAVAVSAQDSDVDDNGIEIPLAGGTRTFAQSLTYTWSRSYGSDVNIVTSALMALEGWAHLRIEQGAPVQSVIDDVLGPEGTPAAYLLVAIDVMLSHWPATRGAIWPFAASATLLAMDRDRYAADLVHAQIATDFLRPEPVNLIRLENLQQRRSRRVPLDTVLVNFGAFGPSVVREAMQAALLGDVARLGPPEVHARGLANPQYAAMSALNRLSLANYRWKHDKEADDYSARYVMPAEEAQMQDALRLKSMQSDAEFSMRTQLMQALTSTTCSPQLLEQGVRWAHGGITALHVEEESDDASGRTRTQLMVAALVMRDGTRAIRTTYGAWAKTMLIEAAVTAPAQNSYVQELPYNAAAITAVGLLAMYRHDSDLENLSHLLHMAVKREANMVSVLRAELAAQRSLPVELARTFVRLGMVSAIYTLPRHGDIGAVGIENYAAHRKALQEAQARDEQARLQVAVDAEIAWLANGGDEPAWPALPDPNPPKERHRLTRTPRWPAERAAAPPRQFSLNAALAARWLSLVAELWQEHCPALLQAFVKYLQPWTAGANGANCEEDEEPGELAFEWNRAYFPAALVAAIPAGEAGIREYVLAPLEKIAEERFLDAAEAILHALDPLWLSKQMVSDDLAVMVRQLLVERLVATRYWHRLAAQRSDGIEVHLGGAIAAMFLGHHDIGVGPHCYLLPPGTNRAYLALPLLTQLTEQAAGSAFVAIAFLQLLKVQPHEGQLPFLVRAVKAWWHRYGASAEFWADRGISKRLSDWIKAAVQNSPAPSAMISNNDLAAIVDMLAQCGTPLASALEELLATR